MKVNAPLVRAAAKQLKGKRLPRFPRALPPRSIEREYERALIPYFRKFAELVEKYVIANISSLVEEVYRNRGTYRADAADAKFFNKVPISLDESFTEDDLRKLAFKFGYSVSEFNAKILKGQMKDVLGIDLLMDEPYLQNELLMFAAQNATLITNVTDDTMNKVQAMVYDGIRNGRRATDIAGDIQAYVDPDEGITRSRAALIARDQVNKLNGQLTGIRQKNLGVNSYVWRTMLDERVRDEHAIKEGEVFSWDDPPSDTGAPGEDIQCRCYAEPNLEDLMGDDDESEDQDDE